MSRNVASKESEMRNKITIIASAILTTGLAGIATPAQANGYIRIGNNCYIPVLNSLWRIPCPREVSGE
jgi:hypothetical protein